MLLLGNVISPVCPFESLPNFHLMNVTKSAGGHSCTTGQIQSFSHLTQTTNPSAGQLQGAEVEGDSNAQPSLQKHVISETAE